MKKYFQEIKIIVFLFVAVVGIVGCGNDDEMMGADPEVSILPYNSAKHIYGTFGFFGDELWEIVIDPATGQFTKILESEESFSSITGRLGARDLTSFEREERILLSPYENNILKIQDLETFNTIEVDLRDTVLDEAVSFPQILRFGADENEVYIMDTDNSIWKTNLESKEVNKIHDGIPVPFPTTISNLFYLVSTGNFIGMTNTDAINDYTGVNIFLFNPALPDSIALISTTDITRGFGFVQHPIEKNTIYYIETVQDDKRFRLMKIEINGDAVNVSQISSSDLAIDNLSLYIQTIHTGSNTYILRGGVTGEERPENTLYSIDLTTGQLVQEVVIDESGTFMKLAGE